MDHQSRPPRTPEPSGVELNKPASFEPPSFESSFDPPAGPAPDTPAPPLARTQDDLNLATLAHASGIITSFTGFGFVPPLVIWLTSKGVRPFASEEAIEALNFQITMTLALLVSILLMIVLIGFVLFPMVWAWGFILSIIATMKVSTGQSYRYPLSIAFIRRG